MCPPEPDPLPLRVDVINGWSPNLLPRLIVIINDQHLLLILLLLLLFFFTRGIKDPSGFRKIAIMRPPEPDPLPPPCGRHK